MPPISRAAFARRVRQLDAEEFEAFVADLYRARGWRVEYRNDRLVLRDDTRESQLALHYEPRFRRREIEADETDAVVTNKNDVAERATVRGVGPDELREMALYGVDRSRANTLIREHLNCSLDTSATDYPFKTILSDPGAVYTIVAIVGALVLVAGLSAGIVGSGTLDSQPEPAATSTMTSTAAQGATLGRRSSTAVPTSNPATTLATTASISDPGGGYPEGLSLGGIIDPAAIARNHARLIANRSYELQLARREYRDGNLIGVKTERVLVASPIRYVSSVNRSGRLSGEGSLVSSASRYANGDFVYSRIRANGSVQYSRAPITTTLSRRNEGFMTERHLPKTRVQRNLRWILTTRKSEIQSSFGKNGTVYYWVICRGNPYSDAKNARTAILIDERGLVHQFYSVFTLPDTDRRVVITFQYVLRNVTIDQPVWYGTAKNRTSDGRVI